ncbi:sugar phosphate nucleotidyltransferase [Helicobacter sp. 23-1044]
MKGIILAAGKGTRLYPLSLKTPKPLLKIKSETLLERNIKFFHTNGIKDITIITGYKHQAFDNLVAKYHLKKVVSAEYERKNSASSLNLVRDILDDALIINGDIFIKDNIFKYIKSGVSQIIAKQITKGKEDGYICDEQGKIIKVVKDSTSGYGDTGMMYLCGDMARAVRENLPEAKDDYFWEDVIYNLIHTHPIYLTKIPNVVFEIDSIKDALIENILSVDEIIALCDGDEKVIREVWEMIGE